MTCRSRYTIGCWKYELFWEIVHWDVGTSVRMWLMVRTSANLQSRWLKPVIQCMDNIDVVVYAVSMWRSLDKTHNEKTQRWEEKSFNSQSCSCRRAVSIAIQRWGFAQKKMEDTSAPWPIAQTGWQGGSSKMSAICRRWVLKTAKRHL